jgi:hypothetical protein
MPLQKLQLRPGINRESTTYANEGGWFESDKIRFRSGYPEKIGGWTNLATSTSGVVNTYNGVNRNMTNWVTLNYSNLNAVGTNQKYYVENGGLYHDVTPQTTIQTGLSNPFASSANSKLITVTDTANGASVGTWVTLTSTATVGGVTVSGDFEIVSVADGNTYSIVYAGSPTSITTDAAGGGTVTALYDIAAGNATYTIGNGWGAGPWNAVIFGTGSSTSSAILYYLPTLTTTGNATTATITFAAQPVAPFTVGQSITVVGVTPAGYNATANVTAVTTSSVSYANATTGAQTVAGNIHASTITVVDASGFTNPAGTIVIESEIITYTGITTNTFTGCVRATDESMGTTHVAGVTVQQYSSETSGDSAYGWGDASATANSIGTQLRLWSADTFGQDLVFAPRGGPIYYWAVDTSAYPRAVTLKSIVVAAGNAPDVTAAKEAVPAATLSLISSDVQRFVIAFGATPFDDDALSAFDPMLVRWSDQENEKEWYPSSLNQSGDYKLAGGSTIVAARTARQEILIWTDAALFTMQYLGPPYVWGFNLLMDNISIISPNAIASVNNQTFWMGVDKFYVYTGRVDTIPCTLRQYVFNNINLDQSYQIVSGTNEGYNEVWWFYPSANSLVNDRYVIYNHLEKIWYYGSMNRTAWLDSPLRPHPMGAQSVQNSFLAVAITSVTATSLTLLNGYSYPESGTLVIDSEYISYTGHDSADGNTLTGCTRGVVNPVTLAATTAATHVQFSAVTFLTPNQVMFHENGTDDYSNITPAAINAYVQSSDFDIGDGHNFGFVWRMLPDLTFDGSTVAAPKVNLSVRPRQDSGTNYGVGNTPAVTSGNNYALSRNYVVQLFTGQVYTRIRGRQMAFKIESTDIGVAWQLGTTRYDVRPDGRR